MPSSYSFQLVMPGKVTDTFSTTWPINSSPVNMALRLTKLGQAMGPARHSLALLPLMPFYVGFFKFNRPVFANKVISTSALVRKAFIWLGILNTIECLSDAKLNYCSYI